MANAFARLEAKSFSHINLADDSLMEEFDGFTNVRITAALGTGRNDPLVASCRLDRLAAFPNIVRNRLFDVDIFAGLTGPDRNERMPVIGGRYGNGVDLFVLQDSPDIRFELNLFSG